jgi:hypothetical protein
MNVLLSRGFAPEVRLAPLFARLHLNSPDVVRRRFADRRGIGTIGFNNPHCNLIAKADARHGPLQVTGRTGYADSVHPKALFFYLCVAEGQVVDSARLMYKCTVSFRPEAVLTLA